MCFLVILHELSIVSQNCLFIYVTLFDEVVQFLVHTKSESLNHKVTTHCIYPFRHGEDDFEILTKNHCDFKHEFAISTWQAGLCITESPNMLGLSNI